MALYVQLHKLNKTGKNKIEIKRTKNIQVHMQTLHSGANSPLMVFVYFKYSKTFFILHHYLE